MTHIIGVTYELYIKGKGKIKTFYFIQLVNISLKNKRFIYYVSDNISAGLPIKIEESSLDKRLQFV